MVSVFRQACQKIGSSNSCVKLVRSSLPFFVVKSTMEFVIKINGTEVTPEFYENTDRWHVTLGDSDQDR